MTRIFLVRHAEPAAGWGDDPDPGLTHKGVAQAEAAAAALVEKGKLQVVSSPMLRCRQTAAPYERISSAVARIEPRVSEVRAPEGIVDRRGWVRETFPWMEGATPRTWASLDRGLRDWRDATVDAVRALNQDTVVFTHFIGINGVITAVTDSDFTIGCRPHHASITELALENGVLRLVSLGEQTRGEDVR